MKFKYIQWFFIFNFLGNCLGKEEKDPNVKKQTTPLKKNGSRKKTSQNNSDSLNNNNSQSMENKENNKNQSDYKESNSEIKHNSIIKKKNNIPKKNDDLYWNKAQDLHGIKFYDEALSGLLRFALIEAIEQINNNKSFFFDQNTPDNIKNNISKYVPDFKLIIGNLNINYGLIHPDLLKLKSEKINFKFDTFVTIFKLMILNSNEYLKIIKSINAMNLYQGNISQDIDIKLQLFAKKISLISIEGAIYNKILMTLAKNDHSDDESLEKQILEGKIKQMENSVSATIFESEILKKIINNNPGIELMAENIIDKIEVISIPKFSNNANKNDIENFINNTHLNLNFINNVNNNPLDKNTNRKDESLDKLIDSLKYDYDIFFLEQSVKNNYNNSSIKNINFYEISPKDFNDYNNFISNENIIQSINKNFFVVETSDSFLIIPRYNGLNKFKSGVIEDYFINKEDSIEMAKKIIAQDILYNHMMNNLNKGNVNNESAIITLNILDKNKNPITYSISLKEFLRNLTFYRGDINNTNNKTDQFFFHLKRLIMSAYIESINLYSNRISEINKPESPISDLKNSSIVISNLSVEDFKGVNAINNLTFTIDFNTFVYLIWEYLDLNIINLIDGIEDIMRNPDTFKAKELVDIFSEISMKNIFIQIIRHFYINNLFKLEMEEGIDNKYMQYILDNAIESVFINQYLKKLLLIKKPNISPNVEKSRQTLSCIKILCSGDELKKNYIEFIKECLKNLGNEESISIFYNDFINKNFDLRNVVKPFYVTFDQIPFDIQKQYIDFLNDENAGNFFYAVFDSKEMIRAGPKYIIYIIPRYDLRNVDKKPGVFVRDKAETEMSLLINEEVNTYLREIIKNNLEIGATIWTCLLETADNKKATKIFPSQIALRLKEINAIISTHQYYILHVNENKKKATPLEKSYVNPMVSVTPVENKNKKNPFEFLDDDPRAFFYLNEDEVKTLISIEPYQRFQLLYTYNLDDYNKHYKISKQDMLIVVKELRINDENFYLYLNKSYNTNLQ